MRVPARVGRRVRWTAMSDRDRHDHDGVHVHDGVHDHDLRAVDELCHLAVAADRLGCRIHLTGADPDLRALLDLAGVDDILGRCPAEASSSPRPRHRPWAPTSHRLDQAALRVAVNRPVDRWPDYILDRQTIDRRAIDRRATDRGDLT